MYPLDGDNGNADAFGLGGPQNAGLLWHSLRVVRRHEAGAMLARTARQRPKYTLNVLAGVSYRNAHVSDCLGREDPIDQVIPTTEEYSYDPDRIVYAWRAQAAADLAGAAEPVGQRGRGPLAAGGADRPAGAEPGPATALKTSGSWGASTACANWA